VCCDDRLNRHVKADHNRDRLLSKAEVIATTMLQFNQIDSNQNGLLEKREVGDYADDAEFSDNDADKSGSLSPEEVITEKLADFKAADTDGDGKLSFTEVKDFYDKQK
jgi:Ca2+-binding EF-hand superfamily protein